MDETFKTVGHQQEQGMLAMQSGYQIMKTPWQEDIAGIMSNDIENGAFLFSQEVGRFPKA